MPETFFLSLFMANMASCGQHLLCNGPRQTCLISSENKKIMKASKGSGMQGNRGLKCKMVKVTAAGMGQMCLRFSWAAVALCYTVGVLPG